MQVRHSTRVIIIFSDDLIHYCKNEMNKYLTPGVVTLMAAHGTRGPSIHQLQPQDRT